MHGDVVGWVADASNGGLVRAFLWDAQMGMRPIFNDATIESAAYAINDDGIVVGYCRCGSKNYAIFVHDLKTSSTKLFSLSGPGARQTPRVAYSVNQSGQVVGESNGKAVLISGGKILDLNGSVTNNPGWSLRIAYDINDAGQIAGFGITSTGEARAFLLTPVQSPNKQRSVK